MPQSASPSGPNLATELVPTSFPRMTADLRSERTSVSLLDRGPGLGNFLLHQLPVVVVVMMMMVPQIHLFRLLLIPLTQLHPNQVPLYFVLPRLALPSLE